MLGHLSGLRCDTLLDKTSIPKIDFLPATAEDYEELISMSRGLYNGLDYLPFRYHSWLKEPQRTMFVAKCEGKVVGFTSIVLVDDGTTAGVEDLRVAPWIRGHGVAGLIRRCFLETLHSNHPEVKRLRFTRDENPPASMLTTFKVISSKAVMSVYIPADQLKTTLRLLESGVNNLDRSKKLSVLGPEEILSFFEESKTKQPLLPGGFLIQDCLPLTTAKSNLNLLLKRQIVWIYSHPGDSSDSACSSKDTTSCDGPHSNLEGFLSLGSPPYPVPFAEGAHCLDIDMFGNDPYCAKVHVLEQLKIGVQALPAGSSIICIIYADESLRSELTQLCEGLTPFDNSREQMIMEMEI
ncbi:histidine N-acetyltransferase-like [Bufo gargarizans]|uniref:histidine N-acetyltransferase-like n=1 Tax=Bufo gargarizans TaxID=30331 RepID=UPI001CF2B040|nr:histidine N-acetyltransferase-like [Bufo gargarizans]